MFLLELHLSLDVLNSTDSTWSVFVTSNIFLYLLISDILIIETLGQGRTRWL